MTVSMAPLPTDHNLSGRPGGPGIVSPETTQGRWVYLVDGGCESHGRTMDTEDALDPQMAEPKIGPV